MIAVPNTNSPVSITSSPGRLELIEGSDPKMLLWYRQPADKWVKALPIGNGRLGAMIFGDPVHERLQLNDVTVWSGHPEPNADRQNAYMHLPEIRSAIRAADYKNAETLCQRYFTGPALYSSSYQTLGDLTVDYTLPGPVTDYQRQLDIAQAVAAVGFRSGNVTYRREAFSSAVDHAVVQCITASRAGAVTCQFRLSRIERGTTTAQGNNTLVMVGDTGGPLKFEVRLRIVANGGTVTAAGDSIDVTGATSVMAVLTSATTYALDYDAGFSGGDLAVGSAQLADAAAKPYSALRAAHVADFHRYFDRVKLDLGRALVDIPTDERLQAYHNGAEDPGFAALFYQFGRYLLISSSRPDNPLPSNSQGIWGDGLDMPWKCDYKSNINYEMNYWPAESANLSEMHEPMIRMTRELVKPGAKTAKAYFGPDAPGWVVGYTTNGWAWTSPGAGLPWGVWFGGSGWMCRDLWEHYAYTRDKEYLRSVYPTMKGAADFWIANLVEGADGKLITSPSTSPENSFTTDQGITATVTEGAAMEREIVWDLLDNTALAADVLGIDSEFSQKAKAARDRIRPLQIGKAGQLMEWDGDWDMNAHDMHHRHVSHLYALFPGHQITLNGTPGLAAAARKSLELRGDDGTGWALAWKLNLWAHLRDGDHAYALLSNQLRYTEESKTVMANAGGTYPNLFDAHPPFQIDGNFGAVSGIDELLLQSTERYRGKRGEDRYVINLLPALPSLWRTGSVHGLCARGGCVVDITWRDGQLASARISSVNGTDAKVRYGGREIDLHLVRNRAVLLNGALNVISRGDT